MYKQWFQIVNAGSPVSWREFPLMNNVEMCLLVLQYNVNKSLIKGVMR